MGSFLLHYFLIFHKHDCALFSLKYTIQILRFSPRPSPPKKFCRFDFESKGIVMMMDGNPLSPNESLLPKKKPGRSIFIGHKMSLHLITEDMIEETDSEQEEEEEEKIAENYQAPPPGLFSPPGIGSTENTSTSKGNEEVPQGLGVAQKLEDVKEGEDSRFST